MNSTPQSDWQEIDTIFDAVLDAPESDRERIIRARGGTNGPLAERLRDLLNAASGGEDILENPSFDGIDELDIGPLSHPLGKRIGKYVVSSLIGQGGMGSVYLARRDDKEFQQT